MRPRLRPGLWAVTAALCAACVFAAACKKESGPDLPVELGPRPEAVDVAKLTAPPLFAHIPADAPYVVASFEAMPLDYLAKLKDAIGPVFARELGVLRADAADGAGDRWISAVLSELDGKWSAKGLASLGFSATPRFAVYGIGVAPVVIRFEVADDKAVLATLERIAQKAGTTLPPLENRHGREFWRIPLPGETGAIVAIADKQLVAAFGPRPAIAAALPQIVGAEKPASSMADGKLLKELIARHRLGPTLVGFLDTKRLVAALVAMSSEDAPPKDCVSELERLAGQIPRVVISYSEVSAKRITAATILELAPPLVEQLKGMKSAVPGLGAALAGDPMFAMGLGLDLARARAVGKDLGTAMVRLGDACEAEKMITGARRMQRGLNEPLPAGLDKLTGAALSIADFGFGPGGPGGPPEKLEGFAMLTATDAKAVFEGIVGQAPPLRDLGIKADGKLHSLDLKRAGLPFQVHAGVGDAAIVVGAGGHGKRLGEQALGYSGGAKAPFLVGSIDYAKLLALTAKFGDDDMREMNQALAKLMGRATFSIDATDAGLAAWFSMELK